MPETVCTVHARKVKSSLLDVWWTFAAVSPNGTVIAESETFVSGRSRVDRRRDEWTQLSTLVTRLEQMGWRVAHTPQQERNPEWFQLQLITGPGDVAATPPSRPISYIPPTGQTWAPPARGGLSVQWMWAITLIVVVLLFVCCVVLALTSQVQIGPA